MLENALTARMHAGWKFRKLSGVFFGKTLSIKLKIMLYKALIRSALCYGANC